MLAILRGAHLPSSWRRHPQSTQKGPFPANPAPLVCRALARMEGPLSGPLSPRRLTVHVSVCIHVHVPECTCAWMCAFMHVCVHAQGLRMGAQSGTHLCTCGHVGVCVCTCMQSADGSLRAETSEPQPPVHPCQRPCRAPTAGSPAGPSSPQPPRRPRLATLLRPP